MKRTLLLILMLAAMPASAAAQRHGPPLYVGGGFGIGSIPYLFEAFCTAPKGDQGSGPDVWAGLRFGRLRVVGRGALIADIHERKACYDENGDFAEPADNEISRRYDHIRTTGTLLDMRLLYTASIDKLTASAGVHVGRVSERRSPYAGATVMLRFHFVGIAADYTLHRAKYRELLYSTATRSYTEIGNGTETAGGLFLKVYVESN
jgi:hypothetical protein